MENLFGKLNRVDEELEQWETAEKGLGYISSALNYASLGSAYLDAAQRGSIADYLNLAIAGANVSEHPLAQAFAKGASLGGGIVGGVDWLANKYYGEGAVDNLLLRVGDSQGWQYIDSALDWQPGRSF